jgi:hypothetical protein
MAFYEEYVRDGADLLTWERHLGDWDRTEEAPLISEKGLEDPGNLAGYLVYFIKYVPNAFTFHLKMKY